MNVLMIENFMPSNTYTYELCKELNKITNLLLLCKTNAGEIENEVNCKKILFAGAM